VSSSVCANGSGELTSEKTGKPLNNKCITITMDSANPGEEIIQDYQ
jgi:hypothetical protein